MEEGDEKGKGCVSSIQTTVDGEFDSKKDKRRASTSHA